MPNSYYKLTDFPCCAANHEGNKDSVVKNTDYRVIEVGDFAYLWVPANYNPKNIQDLLIISHGEAIDQHVIVNDSEPQIQSQSFMMPSGWAIYFYCRHFDSILVKDMQELYLNRSLLQPVESYDETSLCYDYSLKKCTDTKNNSNRGLYNHSYDVLQELMDDFGETKTDIINRFKPIWEGSKKKSLGLISECDEIINEKYTETLIYKKKISDLNKIISKIRTHPYKNTDKISNELRGYKEKLCESERDMESYQDYRQELCQDLRNEKKVIESNIAKLISALNTPYCILTIRSRSSNNKEGVTLSRVISELYETGYNFKQVHSIFCRTSKHILQGHRNYYVYPGRKKNGSFVIS